MIEIILKLIQDSGITNNKLLSDLGLPISAISEWKKGKAKPSTEALVKIADYFNVSVDFLLGRELTKSNDYNISLKNLSSSQRAMLKSYIHAALVDHYRNDDFYNDFSKQFNIEINNVYRWFSALNDYSLEDKINDILSFLDTSLSELLNRYNVVIDTYNVAKNLKLNIANYEDANYPVLINGLEVFESLSNLSFDNLKYLSKPLYEQISIDADNTNSISDDIVSELKKGARMPISDIK